MKKIGTKPNSWPSAGSADRELVLYVEDDDANYRIAEFRLGTTFELVRASNAAEACQIVRDRATDLSAILMDIELRGSDLNGVDLVEILRGKPSRTAPAYARDLPTLKTPIIYVTAHRAKYPEGSLLRSGGDMVIAKPVDFGELNIALTRLHLSRVMRTKPS